MLPLLVAPLRSLDFGDDHCVGSAPLPAHLYSPRVTGAANRGAGGQHRGNGIRRLVSAACRRSSR
jgi:hypothetical protein